MKVMPNRRFLAPRLSFSVAFVSLAFCSLLGVAAAWAAPAFVQKASTVPTSAQSSVSVAYASAQTAGNLNVVVVGWGDAAASVQSVTDSTGNIYVQAVGPTALPGTATQVIYYAANIVAAPANGNTVTVQFNSAAQYVDLRIAEYSGIAAASPVDVVAGATGTGSTANSGAVTTTNANDLIVAGDLVQTRTSAAGSGFTSRVITSPNGDILEDRTVAATGSYSATATLATSGFWIMDMVAFRAASTGGTDTQPPTAPSGLTATAASGTQINLTWTASTDNVGVSNYRIERCLGAGCSNFTQVATSTAATYNDTGLAVSTNYSYRVRAADVAGNLSAYSNIAAATTAAGDTQAPTAPTGLSATASSSTQVNLSWTASTDNVGVTSYLIERCQGASCTSFAQVGTSPTTSYQNTGLSGSTSYSYRVRASDAAGNLSGYSAVASITTQAAATISFIQQSAAVPQSAQTAVSVVYAAAQSAGNLNVVVVGWTDTTATVQSVSDSSGNTYVKAVGPTAMSGNATLSIYYAANIAAATANANSVTVRFSAATQFADVRIAEYAGIATTNPVDVAVGASGTSATANSGTVTTSNANDLIVAGNVVQTRTAAAGSGFTSRIITDPDGDILEDRSVAATGSYSATASLAPAGWWVMDMVAFRAASSGGGDTQPPTAPGGLTATAASGTQINLSWSASTDNVGVSSYLVERCQGSGCSNFAQLATSATSTYSDGGVIAGTSYSYRVRATDVAGNLSAYSNVASATPFSGDTQPPTAPSGLTVTAISGTQINLGWTASTDNVGVTSYLIERCQGAGCSTFAQIATSSTTTYADSGLTAASSYSYRIRATDAAGNLSGYSGTATTSTSSGGGDTQPPDAPTGLSATALSSAQVNVTWTAATDNVGVTNYLVESCQGAGCTSFTQIATTMGTTFRNDVGLTASTTYNYRVRATDAAGNLGPYSNIATATTLAADTMPPSAPTSLAAAVVSAAQINLSWAASTDNVGVTGYLVESCAGAGCTNFAQIGVSSTASFNSTGLASATNYSYRVRAKDAAGNLSVYSNVASATTPGAAPPAFVQVSSATPQTAQASVSATFAAAQSAGNLNVVVVGWTDVTSQITTVTDTKGNAYTLVAGPTQAGSSATQAIYYAAGIASATAGANKVTVTFNKAAAFVDLRIAEYSGIDPADPVDAAAEGTGTDNNSSSGLATTHNTGDLLVGANTVATATANPGTGYTIRIITNPDANTLEDRFVTTAAPYSASATLTSSGWWIMQMVAFRALDSVPPDTTSPTISVSAPMNGSTVSATVTLGATASDNAAVAGVQFQVDGVNVGPALTGSSPYTLSFNTAQFANGTHVVTAYSWDSSGNIGTSAPVTVTFSNAGPGNPGQTGLWSGTFTWPLVAVHANLMYTGSVLMWDGQSFGGFDAKVWNPVTSTFLDVPSADNIFCSGNSQLPDGRILVTGGHVDAHVGINAGNIFDPKKLNWTATPPMNYARWYPTNTELADGRIMVSSGETNCDGCDVAVPEIYNPSTNSWSQLTSAPLQTPFYPYDFLLPDGRFLTAGTVEAPIASKVLNFSNNTWSAVGGATVDGGSALMYLPNKILKTGTSANPDAPPPASASTAYVLDMTQATPTWQQVAPMKYARTYHNLTSLPDGNVLVTGGDTTAQPKDLANAVYPAELWSPVTQTFTTLASMHAPRLYHSTALLLPDARVLIAGGGRWDGTPMPTDQLSAEIFAPPYLFRGARPQITAAPATLTYGQAFTVTTPDAANIASVVLIQLGNVTHTDNMSQRFIPLTFTAGSGTLSLTAPANGNAAPPGYYMLFIVNSNGVPSSASMVRF